MPCSVNSLSTLTDTDTEVEKRNRPEALEHVEVKVLRGSLSSNKGENDHSLKYLTPEQA